MSTQPTPWAIEYLPYISNEGREIPNFRINDARGDAVCETNEDLPAAVQEANAAILAAAPDLLDALQYFFNIMHDHESSKRKGYITLAMKMAKRAIARANEAMQ